MDTTYHSKATSIGDIAVLCYLEGVMEFPNPEDRVKALKNCGCEEEDSGDTISLWDLLEEENKMLVRNY